MWYAAQIVQAFVAVDARIASTEPVGINENVVLFYGENEEQIRAIATNFALENDRIINDHSKPGSFFKRDHYDIAQHFLFVRTIASLGEAMPEDGTIVLASDFELDGGDVETYLRGDAVQLDYLGSAEP